MNLRMFPLMEEDKGGSGGDGGGKDDHDPKRTAELLHLTAWDFWFQRMWDRIAENWYLPLKDRRGQAIAKMSDAKPDKSPLSAAND